MATITHTCAQCGKRLGVPDRYLGRDLKCPQCGNPFRIDPEPPHPPAIPAESLELGSTPAPAPATPAQPPGTAQPPMAPPAAPAPPPHSEPFAQAEGAQEPIFGLTATAVSWRVRRVGVLSVALVSAVIHAVLGLFVGLLVAAVGMLPRAAGVAVSMLRGPIFGAVAVVALPFVYAVIGFLSGLVIALLYNLAARLTGGIELTME